MRILQYVLPDYVIYVRNIISMRCAIYVLLDPCRQSAISDVPVPISYKSFNRACIMLEFCICLNHVE
jgi:hypothetical protein